jgi:very-short-patch-repair endonuclease
VRFPPRPHPGKRPQNCGLNSSPWPAKCATLPQPAEDKLWQRLRNRQLHGFKFRRQHAIERFIADFYCAEARLIVEVEGAIHQYTQEEDAIRQEFLESLGLRVLRFTNDEINTYLDKVLEKISAALVSSTPQRL